MAAESVGGGNIVTTGALDSGSITSGFGAIDNGTSNIRSATITAETAFVPDASGGADLGTTALEFNDAFFNDSAVINFGDDQDTKLTHTDGTGLTLNSTNKLCFNDASQFVQGTSAASKVLSADSNNLSKITGAIYIEEATLSFDATQDWDVRASPVAQVTLTANVTFDARSNPTTGQFISIVCIQDGTGSRTIAWNAVFEFASDTAPTATTTANLGDMFNFRYNGTKWLEVGRNLALTLS